MSRACRARKIAGTRKASKAEKLWVWPNSEKPRASNIIAGKECPSSHEDLGGYPILSYFIHVTCFQVLSV